MNAKRQQSSRKPPARRYAAKLLFQWRVMVDGSSGKRRLCEERIISFQSTHGRTALREARRRGRAAQHSFTNSDGNWVHFEFVGTIELLCLGPECEADEVWYEITERIRPMERRAKLIPPESRLHAIRNRD